MPWVQGGHAKSNHAGSAGSVAVTLSNPVKAGSCILIGVFGGSLASMGSLTLTDDKGNSYNLSDQYDDNAVYFFSFTSYYLSNILNGPSTFTFTWGSSASSVPVISVDEYSGVSIAADPRDGHAINHQSSASNATDAVTSGSITTTSHRDIIWGATVNFNNNNDAFVFAGTGFTARVLETTGYLYGVEDKIQTAAGSIAATFSNDISGDGWATAVIALKPITFGLVQSNSAYDTSTQKLSISFGNPVGGGNCVVVGVTTLNDVNAPPISVTDDKGNIYNQSDILVDTDTNDQQGFLATYYLSNIMNAPTTITIDFGVGHTHGHMAIHEYTGVSKALDPRDGHAINWQDFPSPTGTDALTSGNITTTVDGDIIWGYITNMSLSGAAPNPGTGFTSREVNNSFDGWRSEDKVQATAGTVAATFTSSTQQVFMSAVMALKPATGTMKVQKAYRQNVIKDQ